VNSEIKALEIVNGETKIEVKENGHVHKSHKKHKSHKNHDKKCKGHKTDSIKRKKDQKNINVRAAMVHVIGDLLQSIGVTIAAIFIYVGGEKYYIADPICTFLFSILVVCTTIPIVKDCIHVIMEGSPMHLEIEKFRKKLLEIIGVLAVHDLHIWSLSEERVFISAHIISN